MTDWLDLPHAPDPGEFLALRDDDSGICIRLTKPAPGEEAGMVEFSVQDLSTKDLLELLGSVIGTVTEDMPIEVRFAFVNAMIEGLLPEIQPEDEEAAS